MTNIYKWSFYVHGVWEYVCFSGYAFRLALTYETETLHECIGRPSRPSKRPQDSFRSLNLKQTNKQTKQSNNKDSASFSAHFALFDVNAPIIGMVHLYRYCVFLCTKKWECNTLHKGFWEGKNLLDFGFHECYVIPNSLWASLTSGVGLAGH